MSLGFVDWRTKTRGQISHARACGLACCEKATVLTILVSDRFTDGDAGLLVGVLQDHNLGELYTESVPASVNPAAEAGAGTVPAGHGIGELWVTVASQQLDGVGRHVCWQSMSNSCYRSPMLQRILREERKSSHGSTF